ncbi:YggT family protein [Vagococcus coleopterorum]|uniref:YggT family protein n=1 Tax=Vagococcus coleopterorum TaxID=2714946 RepID=A0A6G8APQ5_9ENTE|nr:YggT family protein [Vagococcus coleopterorum]QIL46949.1 YggT family protein [Vagococcus coleopterorum]
MWVYNLIQLINLAVEIYSAALIVYALLSWFPGAYDSAIGRFLSKICDPYIQIFERLNLNFGGISFSIMVALFALYFGQAVIVKLLIKLFLV